MYDVSSGTAPGPCGMYYLVNAIFVPTSCPYIGGIHTTTAFAPARFVHVEIHRAAHVSEWTRPQKHQHQSTIHARGLNEKQMVTTTGWPHFRAPNLPRDMNISTRPGAQRQDSWSDGVLGGPFGQTSPARVDGTANTDSIYCRIDLFHSCDQEQLSYIFSQCL